VKNLDHVSVDTHLIASPGNGRPAGARRPGFPKKTVENVRLLWEHRRMLCRVGVWALVASTLIAFLIPKRYEATTQLMPPEEISTSGSGMGGSIAGTALGGIASDLIGMKSTGALFVTILECRTISDRIIEQFHLDRVYHTKKIEDTRMALWRHVETWEDHKSGIIGLTVTDTSPERAAMLAQAYVTELDRLVAQVSTSSARRERIFLEERLKSVKNDLDNAARPPGPADCR
jgi:uncharacterized protein involved in exopolysaccharide biosynthesis